MRSYLSQCEEAPLKQTCKAHALKTPEIKRRNTQPPRYTAIPSLLVVMQPAPLLVLRLVPQSFHYRATRFNIDKLVLLTIASIPKHHCGTICRRMFMYVDTSSSLHIFQKERAITVFGGDFGEFVLLTIASIPKHSCGTICRRRFMYVDTSSSLLVLQIEVDPVTQHHVLVFST